MSQYQDDIQAVANLKTAQGSAWDAINPESAARKSTLQVAHWLADHPKIQAVFHPALASCPGHDVWERDFTGSTSVFSIWFKDDVSPTQVEAVIDSLELFQIGLSWGGVNSLAIVYPDVERPGQDYAGRLVRLNIGLEHTDDLIRDLKNALQTHF